MFKQYLKPLFIAGCSLLMLAGCGNLLQQLLLPIHWKENGNKSTSEVVSNAA